MAVHFIMSNNPSDRAEASRKARRAIALRCDAKLQRERCQTAQRTAGVGYDRH